MFVVFFFLKEKNNSRSGEKKQNVKASKPKATRAPRPQDFELLQRFSRHAPWPKQGFVFIGWRFEEGQKRMFLGSSSVGSSLSTFETTCFLNMSQGTENGVEQMVSKAHQSASGHITMHQLCFALQSLFLQKRHAYTCIYSSLDQLVRNANQLVTAQKITEGVHYGASVVHHDASRFTLDTICSIPFSFPRNVICITSVFFYHGSLSFSFDQPGLPG